MNWFRKVDETRFEPESSRPAATKSPSEMRAFPRESSLDDSHTLGELATLNHTQQHHNNCDDQKDMNEAI